MRATFAKMLLQSEDEESDQDEDDDEYSVNEEETSYKRSKVTKEKRISFRRTKKNAVVFTPPPIMAFTGKFGSNSPFGNCKARRVHRSMLEDFSTSSEEDEEMESSEDEEEDEENVAPTSVEEKKNRVRFPSTPNRSFLVCTPSPRRRRPLSARRLTTPGTQLACDRRRTPKNDPVNRYHQLSRVWNQSPFLAKKKVTASKGRRMDFNNSNIAGFTPRRDKLRNEYRDQLKIAREEEEKKNKRRVQRDHRRIMPSNYVVPSMKRRDQLRWNVRAAMLVQDE